MHSRIVVVLAILLLVLGPTMSAQESQWEPAIAKFEERDAKNPPAKGGIVFVGSSSIRMWNLKKSFPGWDVLNRGFGGSMTSDSVEFAERIILKYEPRQVVIYAGDNDIARNKTPQTVFDDTKELFGIIHDALPETKITYIAIKPSIARWNLVGKMREANSMIESYSTQDERIDFVDVDTPMIGEDGQPKPELFIQDGLHMTAEGYSVWNELLLPRLVKKES